MLRQVYPDGRVTASGMRGDGASNLRQQSWSQFAERIKPDSAFQERIADPAIEIDGDIAMVWAPFVVRVAGKASNCGVDHFDLVRENGAWKVMNLTFSSRTTGCLSSESARGHHHPWLKSSDSITCNWPCPQVRNPGQGVLYRRSRSRRRAEAGQSRHARRRVVQQRNPAAAPWR